MPTMTDNELRVAIAEACGYAPEPNRPGFWLKEGTIIAYSLRVDGFPLPDYPNDLNAMHGAAMWLKDALPAKYAKYLFQLRKIAHPEPEDATARQRALAFVQTITQP